MEDEGRCRAMRGALPRGEVGVVRAWAREGRAEEGARIAFLVCDLTKRENGEDRDGPKRWVTTSKSVGPSFRVAGAFGNTRRIQLKNR